MHCRTASALAILLSALLLSCGSLRRAGAQQSGSSNSSSSSDSANQTQAPAADANAFPSDVSRKAAADRKKSEQQSAQQPPAASDVPSGTPDAAKPKPDPDDNAFPEETSRKAAADAKATAARGSDPGGASGSSDASSSSNPGVSSSSDYDNRMTGGRNAVPTNVPMPHVDGKDPVKEDLNIGGYYLESGNFAGAYLRFKEAASLAPENTDAIFGLAESARHLKRRDEALANYQLFLQVVSSGSKVKDARKAVASLEKSR